MAGKARLGWRYRINVASRVIAGSAGAYAVAALCATALARVWPGTPVEATIPATLIGLLMIPGMAVWAFLAPGPWRAWAGVLGAAALFAAIAWATGPFPA